MQKSYSAFNMNLEDQTNRYILWKREHIVNPSATSKSIPVLAKFMENRGPIVKSVLQSERNSLDHSKTSVSDLKRAVTI